MFGVIGIVSRRIINITLLCILDFWRSIDQLHLYFTYVIVPIRKDWEVLSYLLFSFLFDNTVSLYYFKF